MSEDIVIGRNDSLVEFPKRDELRDFQLMMEQKGLAHEGVKTFGEQMLRLGAPTGFLNRLAQSVVYIDEQQLQRDISHMAQELGGSIGNKPFTFVSYNKGRSADWLLSQLQLSGFNAKPSRHLIVFDEYGLETNELATIQPEEKLVFIDDWSLGGDQIGDIVRRIPSSQHLSAFVLYRTSYARERQSAYSNVDVRATANDNILTLHELLESEDIDFVRRMYDETERVDDNTYFVYDDSKRLDTSATMLFSAHKVPDTIMLLFKGRRKLKSTGEVISALIPPKKPIYSQDTTPYV